MFDQNKSQEDKFPGRDARVWQDSLEKIRTVTSGPYVVTPDDDIILCDGSFNITLPPVISRRKITIIKISGSSGNIVSSPDGANINASSSYTVTGLYLPVIFKSTGTIYYVTSGLNTNSMIQTNTSSPALTLRSTGLGNVVTFQDVGSDTTPTIIDANGKVVTGWTSWENEWYASGHIANSWTVSQTVNASGFGVVNYGGAAGLLLMRSDSATIGDRTIVANNDRIGQISFAADDGSTASYIIGAAIYGAIDGVPGVGDMPTRLMFLTTPDGSSSVVERMRISNDGTVRVFNDLKVDGKLKTSDAKMYFFSGF